MVRANGVPDLVLELDDAHRQLAVLVPFLINCSLHGAMNLAKVAALELHAQVWVRRNNKLQQHQSCFNARSIVGAHCRLRFTWADFLICSACFCAISPALKKRLWRWVGTLAMGTMLAPLTHTGHSFALVWQAEHARWPHVVKMETWRSRTAKHTSQ